MTYKFLEVIYISYGVSGAVKHNTELRRFAGFRNGKSLFVEILFDKS